MKRTEHQQSDFQKQRVSKAYPTTNCFFVQSYGKSTQILHHFEVRIKYSREGAVQEISTKESWRTIGTNRACETNLPASPATSGDSFANARWRWSETGLLFICWLWSSFYYMVLWAIAEELHFCIVSDAGYSLWCKGNMLRGRLIPLNIRGIH